MHQLIVAGANVSLVTDDGTSALWFATEKSRPDCMDVLIKAGSNVNTCKRDGVHALQISAMKGQTKCLQLLLEAGATVNAVALDGTSPLGIATSLGKHGCVALLLQAKSNVSVLTPLRPAQVVVSITYRSLMMQYIIRKSEIILNRRLQKRQRSHRLKHPRKKYFALHCISHVLQDTKQWYACS